MVLRVMLGNVVFMSLFCLEACQIDVNVEAAETSSMSSELLSSSSHAPESFQSSTVTLQSISSMGESSDLHVNTGVSSGETVTTRNNNFHIYLAFGQSNMEGQGKYESQDSIVDSRFKTFQAVDCPEIAREKENWYTAYPPTTRCHNGLSPVDYFGRTMVANLPDSIIVGVINVSVGGSDVRLFDKDLFYEYDSAGYWYNLKIEMYEGNPYQRLVDLGKLAQNDGVIKGILIHQGESNTGQAVWLSHVKKIYTDLLFDLSLEAESVPLLAGELYSGEGNCCSIMNPIINRLPDTIPTAHVISSEGCTAFDNAHFDSEGYRELGRRYAAKMLTLLGI